ncbi:MAG: DUF3616 domain-containing protein [Pseudomonadota bacterium]
MTVVGFDRGESNDFLSFEVVPSGLQPTSWGAGDWFGWGAYGDWPQVAGVPFALADDSVVGISGAPFPGDTQGIVDGTRAADDAFFGVTDTVNGSNGDGVITARWTFDVAGVENLALGVDLAAMGDFEADDRFVFRYALDGGSFIDALVLAADEAGSQSYTMQSGLVVALDDPMTSNGITLDDELQRFTTGLSGTGSVLTVEFEAEANGSEALVFDDLEISGGPGAFDLQVTEIWPGQGGGQLTVDWFEITNRGSATWVAGVDGDLFYDDESQDPSTADPIVGLTRLEPGQSAVVLVSDAPATDVATFRDVWDGVITLDGVEIATTDGAGLSGGGDGVTLFVGAPALATIADFEAFGAVADGVSFDVEAGAASVAGTDGAVATVLTAGGVPAVGSPGNGAPVAVAFDLRITEIWPGQDGADLTEDWFEITNVGSGAWIAGVDGELFYDDESSAPADATPITGLTRIDPGTSAVVVVSGDPADVARFDNVWGEVVSLIGVEVGRTDGSGLGQGGDAVTLYVGAPAADTEVDRAAYPSVASGLSYDVELAAPSAVGNANGAVETVRTGGTNGDEPAVGSPGNGPALPPGVNLQVTEIWVGQAGTDLTADWFEITNRGSTAWVAGVDGDLFYDDISASAADADVIEGLTRIDPGQSVVVVIGAPGDVATFRGVWSPVADLTGVAFGSTDGAGLGQGGDAVTLWIGDPLTGGVLADGESTPAAPSGVSYDVDLVAFSEVGNANGAVATVATGGTAGDEPAIGSPGNRGAASIDPDAPVLTADAAATGPFLDLGEGVARVAGTIGDPTDPARVSGLALDLVDADTALEQVVVTVQSLNESVVDASGLELTRDGGNLVLTITPTAAGTATIQVTATDSDGKVGTYSVDYRASAASTTADLSRFHTGNSDASAAVAIDDDYMIVADDEEDQILGLYDRDRSGLPLKAFSFTAELGLPAGAEIDQEGVARVDDTLYWIGSHETDARSYLYSTELTPNGADSTLTFGNAYATLRAELAAWDAADGHGLGADFLFGGTGFNVEGLTMAPGSTATALLGFRAPTPGGDALVVPITNFTILPGAGAGSAVFGEPVLLDLGGRGIRDLDGNGETVVILAGPPGATTASNAATAFALYGWSGDAAEAPVVFESTVNQAVVDTIPVVPGGDTAPGAPEIIVEVPDDFGPGSTLQILTDNGDTDWYVDGTASKDLAASQQETFRSDLVTVDLPTGLVLPVVESFEDEPDTSYELIDVFDDGGFDFFGRYPVPDDTNGARDDFQFGWDGAFGIIGQDHDGTGGPATRIVRIEGVNTANVDDLLLTVGLGALASEPAFENYEAADGDGIAIYAAFDDGGRELVARFAPPAGGTGDLREDTDGDGIGDGARLTTTLTDFSWVVDATGNGLDLEIELTSTGSFEPLAVDHVRIEQAAFDLQITEIWPGQSGTDLTVDWFEITNRGNVAWVEGVDPDLFYDDESADPADADLIQGLNRLDPGQSAIVVLVDGLALGDEVLTFNEVWADVANLSGVEVGYALDAAGLGGGGDAATLFLGGPSAATIADQASYPDTGANDGQSYDVDLMAFSTEGNANEAVVTTVLGGNDGTVPATASPGNQGAAIVFVAIPEIQGASHRSPFEGELVRTGGIVIAVAADGFYLQDALGDGEIATSDAVFVAGDTAGLAVGDAVEVVGAVTERLPTSGDARDLRTTTVDAVAVDVRSSGNALPAATVIGSAGRQPPSEVIDDDAFASFDPSEDGIDFFESLEGMRVTAQDVLATSPTNRFGEIFGVVDGGDGASGLSSRGTLNISPDDFNPEKIQVQVDPAILPGFDIPLVDAGAGLGDVTGVVSYAFGNFEILATESFAATPAELAPEVTALAKSGGVLTVASYNVLNLDPNDGDGDTDVADGRFDAIAQQIVESLGSPDVIGLQEIQDDTGETDDGVTAAGQTLQQLVDAIAAAGGPAYAFIDNTFIDNNASGGAPGANIRTAFLYDPARVELVDGSVRAIGDQGEGGAFDGARLPLVADFRFGDETVTVVNNHFSSKGGSAPILGTDQPFDERQEDPTVNGSLDERQAQSGAVQAFLAEFQQANPDANVVVVGDFNEFEFVSPVLDLVAGGFTNLTETLPEDERYTFNFQGNSQSLDHILVSDNLADRATFDIVHVNSEFAETDARASDHDPLVAALDFRTLVAGTPGGDRMNGTDANERFEGGQGTDLVRAGAGDDLMLGGEGRDLLFGGDGADRFALDVLGGGDLIYDFEVGTDTLLMLIDEFLTPLGEVDVAALSLETLGSSTIVVGEADGTSYQLASLRGVDVDDPAALFDTSDALIA